MEDYPFLRNEMLWGEEAQRRLARAHVILFGLGGVGSYTAECLARSGVGELTLVDSDCVSVTNLNRQLEALRSTVGQPKAEAVAARLRDICARRGIRANELANISGVTPSTVYSLLDTRRRDVSVTTVKKLCDGLDISIADFFDADIFRDLEQEIQ